MAAAQELGLSLETATEAALGDAEAMGQVDAAVQGVADRYTAVYPALDGFRGHEGSTSSTCCATAWGTSAAR